MAKKSKRRKSARKTMSAARPTTRRKLRKRRGLAEMFNATTATAAAKATGAGAIGGVLAGGLLRIMRTRPTYERIGAGLAASFFTYAVMGMPSMAAGMSGAVAALESQPIYDKFMSESLVDYADTDALNSMPAQVMSENGEVLTLAEVDGEAVYLNEAEQIMLAETAYLQEGVYPDYAVQY